MQLLDIDEPKTPAAKDHPRPSAWQMISVEYVPTAFLLWSVIGIFRPVFDPTAAYNPVFWYVCGASLLTLYGRHMTQDLGKEDDDEEEQSLDEKWKFDLPPLFRRERK